jgi:hypothetical protein
MMRWLAVRETGVVESDDPVNYRCANGRLESLTSEATRPAQYIINIMGPGPLIAAIRT